MLVRLLADPAFQWVVLPTLLVLLTIGARILTRISDLANHLPCIFQVGISLCVTTIGTHFTILINKAASSSSVVPELVVSLAVSVVALFVCTVVQAILFNYKRTVSETLFSFLWGWIVFAYFVGNIVRLAGN